ncbi:MAG: hypothetical protein RL701_2661 [Pseudomonadota bacterium]
MGQLRELLCVICVPALVSACTVEKPLSPAASAGEGAKPAGSAAGSPGSPGVAGAAGVKPGPAAGSGGVPYSGPAAGGGGSRTNPDAGVLEVDVAQLSASQAQNVQRLKGAIDTARAKTSAQLEAESALPFASKLNYDPLKAQHMDLIQASALKLVPAELAGLAQNGFVISGRQRFPSFTYGYASIYASDLPVYISADSILDAVHRSYDDILKDLELRVLSVDLTTLLTSLRAKLGQQAASQTRDDLVFYIEVAQGLLSPNDAVPIGSAAAQEIVVKARAAGGPGIVTLFGSTREEDFSQFKPRGHYENDPSLQAYFRTMMWLGRSDFRMVETEGDVRKLQRRQVEAVFLLNELFDAEDRARFERIDNVVRMFVGESDNMTLQQVPALLTALKISKASELAPLPDATIARAILDGGLGKQQIMSHLMLGGLTAPVPLNASFLLFGQRYVVDSHVFSNVVWDRVRAMRMMPNPLDAAYAALANDQAVSLLHSELEKYPYAGDLAAMRALVDEHDTTFWHANMYNDWLSALRTLSPQRSVLAAAASTSVPTIVKTEAWGRRILDTQLASWAQLRHDTLLYAKQSYTGGAVCEFPDAAVDPYPEFYAAIARFAEHGQGIAALIGPAVSPDVAERINSYFTRLHDVATQLKAIADTQLTGMTPTAEQLAFINDAVVIKHDMQGCVPVDIASGWYTKLFFEPYFSLSFSPTIADVHTQSTDESGAPVGRVLHVGTGHPRLLVVTQDSCATPRAFVGLSSAYYEKVTDNWVRLTDSQWASEISTAVLPPEPMWVQDLIPVKN